MRNERFCQPISSQELAGQLAPRLTRYFRRTVIDPSTNQLKTVSTPVALGLKFEMTKYEAREKLELEIKRLTGQIAEDGVVRNRSVTFDWFVQNRYLGIGGARKARTNQRGQQGQQQASDRTNSARETTTPQTEKPCAKAVRGVVLEFATRMRQSRGRRELLNA
jgi:hypothetical protein